MVYVGWMNSPAYTSFVKDEAFPEGTGDSDSDMTWILMPGMWLRNARDPMMSSVVIPSYTRTPKTSGSLPGTRAHKELVKAWVVVSTLVPFG